MPFLGVHKNVLILICFKRRENRYNINKYIKLNSVDLFIFILSKEKLENTGWKYILENLD